MARVGTETVDHLARLARLSLSDEERRLFARQLEEVLGYAESLQALDTEAVEPMSHARTVAALRDDVPVAGLSREEALGSAPDAEAGLFRVPRVLGG